MKPFLGQHHARSGLRSVWPSISQSIVVAYLIYVDAFVAGADGGVICDSDAFAGQYVGSAFFGIFSIILEIQGFLRTTGKAYIVPVRCFPH